MNILILKEDLLAIHCFLKVLKRGWSKDRHHREHEISNDLCKRLERDLEFLKNYDEWSEL